MTRTLLTLFASAGALALGGCATDMAAESSMNASADSAMAGSTSTRAATSTRASAQMRNPTVGGAQMFANRTIIDNAVNSPEHRTLVKLVQMAGLTDTLRGAGPFTLFAPTDNAFSRQNPQTLQALQDPANKQALTDVLTYHVVPGTYTTDQLMALIKAGGGRAMLKTVNGADLTLEMEGPNIVVRGANSSVGYIDPQERNVRQSNGIIQVVNGVLLPPVPAAGG